MVSAVLSALFGFGLACTFGFIVLAVMIAQYYFEYKSPMIALDALFIAWIIPFFCFDRLGGKLLYEHELLAFALYFLLLFTIGRILARKLVFFLRKRLFAYLASL